jgi:hypothetical protein
MGRTAGLDADETWPKFCEKGQHLRAPERLALDDSAYGIYAVNLKNILGQIQADRANLHGGWLLCSGLPDRNPLWHLDAVSGSHPPHPLFGLDEAVSGHLAAAIGIPTQNRLCYVVRGT